MTIQEAVATVRDYSDEQNGKYVTSETAVRITKVFHGGDLTRIRDLLSKVANDGIDVVDDDYEEIYRRETALDDLGDESDDKKTAICSDLKNKWRGNREINGPGLLGKAGLRSPVLNGK